MIAGHQVKADRSYQILAAGVHLDISFLSPPTWHYSSDNDVQARARGRGFGVRIQLGHDILCPWFDITGLEISAVVQIDPDIGVYRVKDKADPMALVITFRQCWRASAKLPQVLGIFVKAKPSL